MPILTEDAALRGAAAALRAALLTGDGELIWP
jgi:hypothetical protein